ncbi:metal-sensitive transcriptional regulator [Bacillus aquiflavi]|uniref:Metal-sensitive transcriptional regulator n=1 Tax=Bacillus aquiflavi TaxID=2672567 RepID=A0A6B3W093_9BACI|nr:metal-sensitive transcriptional regulator [Bacillus aquiflavi]MBA4537738.1 metal-sensitive transcriptional regulator [Bacillus aquiflavi]NEY81995.1 metal-sensitive transcriptional regulator [Bacillus aquiflavi]UAC49888.1 metal-sensitive transcriptional regulator [Bacillus aquiflavi]
MKFDKDIVNRMKRIEGQVKGVIRMMESGDDCKDVTTQLTAIRSAADKTVALIVSRNLERCLIEDIHAGKDSQDAVNEAVQLLVKSR